MTEYADYVINVRIPHTPELATADPRDLCRHLESVVRVAVKQVANAKADVCAEAVLSGCDCCGCEGTPQGATSCAQCSGRVCDGCTTWMHPDGRPDHYDAESCCTEQCWLAHVARRNADAIDRAVAAHPLSDEETPL